MSEAINKEKAEHFKHSIMGMISGSLALTTIRLGHELGMFKELNQNGPVTSKDLATNVGISPRYTYEWCLHATAVGILEYDEATDTFALPPEHAGIMASDEGLTPMICGLVANASHQYPLLKEAYKSDTGILWGDMVGMTEGARGFFKPVYEKLMPAWVSMTPSLKSAMSEPGAKIADLGCGCGISTRSLASNFPNSQVIGVDFDEVSIENANKEIAKVNLTNAKARVIDSHTWADEEEKESFSVVTFFDCFHDMADPEGVAAEAHKALKPGGKIFLIEPLSSKGDSTKDRLSIPTVPMFSGFSALCCTACGKVVPGKEGLGTTCGTDRYEALFTKAGFSSFETFGEDIKGELNPTAAGFRLMLVTK